MGRRQIRSGMPPLFFWLGAISYLFAQLLNWASRPSVLCVGALKRATS